MEVLTIYHKGETLVVEGNLEYEVLDEINYNDNTYYYLINTNDKTDIALIKFVNDTLQNIENDEEFKTVLMHILNSNKDSIINTINEEN